jgi:hypothetical protein
VESVEPIVTMGVNEDTMALIVEDDLRPRGLT